MNRNQIKRAAAIPVAPAAAFSLLWITGTIYRTVPWTSPENEGLLITVLLGVWSLLILGFSCFVLVFIGCMVQHPLRDLADWVKSGPEPEQPEAPSSVSRPQDEIRRYR